MKRKCCLFGLWASCFEGFSRKRELQTNNEKQERISLLEVKSISRALLRKVQLH